MNLENYNLTCTVCGAPAKRELLALSFLHTDERIVCSNVHCSEYPFKRQILTPEAPAMPEPIEVSARREKTCRTCDMPLQTSIVSKPKPGTDIVGYHEYVCTYQYCPRSYEVQEREPFYALGSEKNQPVS